MDGALCLQDPPCKKGKWEIKKFNVEMDLTNLRAMRSGRGSFPGEYTQLIHADRGIIMSDTIAEIEDCRTFYRRAYGRVLIHGLGLGCLLQALLLKDNIEHVDVVEIDQDVIDLVSPHFSEYIKKGRLEIHHGDCLTYKWEKGTKWDYVWHDIWDNICGDNLPDMKTLHRKFGRRCKYQESWAMDLIRQY